MKKLGLLTIILLVSLSVSFAQTVKKPLYERLGGQPAIEAVVKDFLGRVLNDERINKKFAKSDISRLQKNLTDYVCSATGGPCKYMGGDMKTVHQNLGITQAEFNTMIMNLVETMDSFKITAAEKNELLGLFGATAKDVAIVKTNATGTELPTNFKPLPPLTTKSANFSSKVKWRKYKSADEKAAQLLTYFGSSTILCRAAFEGSVFPGKLHEPTQTCFLFEPGLSQAKAFEVVDLKDNPKLELNTSQKGEVFIVGSDKNKNSIGICRGVNLDGLFKNVEFDGSFVTTQKDVSCFAMVLTAFKEVKLNSVYYISAKEKTVVTPTKPMPKPKKQ